jgi:hypothetical protein
MMRGFFPSAGGAVLPTKGDPVEDAIPDASPVLMVVLMNSRLNIDTPPLKTMAFR